MYKAVFKRWLVKRLQASITRRVRPNFLFLIWYSSCMVYRVVKGLNNKKENNGIQKVKEGKIVILRTSIFFKNPCLYIIAIL